MIDQLNPVRRLYMNLRRLGYKPRDIKRELGIYCGVSPRSIENWIYEHRCPHYKTVELLKSFKMPEVR